MIYFVTEAVIKTKTNLNRNIDFAEIVPNIKVAAIQYVRTILGKKFFDDILNKFNEGTLDADELELVEIIELIVAYRAADLTLPYITFSFKNKGIQSQFGDNSGSEGLDVLNYMRNEVRKFAATKENELKSFLELNKKLFPLYTSNENKEIVAPSEGEQDLGFDII